MSVILMTPWLSAKSAINGLEQISFPLLKRGGGQGVVLVRSARESSLRLRNST